jgi:hypothetical protein
MLKGSREGILVRIQPLSIHGQVSLDVHYRFEDDADGQVRVARIGPEAVSAALEPGDRIRLEFLLGVVTSVTKA